jgi:arsenite methyltransferase
MNVEATVRERYSQGAQQREDSLCCPVDYDRTLLQALPQEIIDKDYGCGDPSRYVLPGDTVLDLGSGGGKICYLAAQLVGPSGKVLGIDINDDMLALARKYQDEMAEKLGSDRVRFVKGHIQDLALDVRAMEEQLARQPISDSLSLSAFQSWQAEQRRSRPLVADASVDLVISNCVLNLVDDADKVQLVHEIFRVLKPGGRVAICDIVADEPIPSSLKADPALWSGCISGAFVEHEFVAAFVDGGFAAVRIDQWSVEPWRVVDGIEFRSVTLTAVKGEGKICIDRGHAVIYRGPYAEVRDEEGHVFPRGERMAVCERTFRSITEGPYRDDFVGIAPRVLSEPVAWCAPPNTRRAAADTKGGQQIIGGDCGSGASCC